MAQNTSDNLVINPKTNFLTIPNKNQSSTLTPIRYFSSQNKRRTSTSSPIQHPSKRRYSLPTSTLFPLILPEHSLGSHSLIPPQVFSSRNLSPSKNSTIISPPKKDPDIQFSIEKLSPPSPRSSKIQLEIGRINFIPADTLKKLVQDDVYCKFINPDSDFANPGQLIKMGNQIFIHSDMGHSDSDRVINAVYNAFPHAKIIINKEEINKDNPLPQKQADLNGLNITHSSNTANLSRTDSYLLTQLSPEEIKNLYFYSA